jgi:hypothetical protein
MKRTIPLAAVAAAASLLAVSPALAAKKPPAKHVKVEQASAARLCGVYYLYHC